MIVRTLPVVGKRTTAFPRWFVQGTGFLVLMRSPASEAKKRETEGVGSLILRDFLHHGILHPVLKGLPVLLRGKGVGGCSQEVCGDLTGVWIGEEEEPQSNPDEHLQHRTTPFWWFKDPLDLVGGKFSPRFWCRDVVQNEGVTLFSRPSFGKMGHTRFSVKTNVKTAPQKPSVFGGVKTT